MATSPDFVRMASSAMRPLTNAIFAALRDALLVADTLARHFRLILGNSAARRCFLGNPDLGSLIDQSLYSLLESAMESAVVVSLGALAIGRPSGRRMLTWRFPQGEMSLSTELKLLSSAPPRQTVMVTFAEPAFV